MEAQRRILTFVTRANWVLLCAAGMAGFWLATPRFAMGVVGGGLLVTVNFHLLHRTLKRSLKPPHTASVGSILAKYYIRFTASGVVIFLLIATHTVDPFGLFIGLSVVVASIMAATVRECGKLILRKEAI